MPSLANPAGLRNRGDMQANRLGNPLGTTPNPDSVPTALGRGTMKRLTTHSSWMDYRDTLDSLTPFTTSGALKGVLRPSSVSLGSLPREYHSSALRAVYVVYSYRTPIAWLTDGVWVTPPVKYSVTTTRHQGKVNTALANLYN